MNEQEIQKLRASGFSDDDIRDYIADKQRQPQQPGAQSNADLRSDQGAELDPNAPSQTLANARAQGVPTEGRESSFLSDVMTVAPVFLAENAGILDVTGASAQTATNYGVSAENSGIVHARNVNATGAGLYGFRTTVGGKLDITGATGTSLYVENLQIAAGLTTNNGSPNPFSVSSSVMSVDSSVASVFKAETYRSGDSFTLSNNTATSFSIPLVGSNTSEWGTLIISSSATGNGRPNGIIRYRVGNTPATNNISLITTTNVTLTTGVLTGTTGSVGDFTISAATDAKLYFENRTGSSVSFRIAVTG